MVQAAVDMVDPIAWSLLSDQHSGSWVDASECYQCPDSAFSQSYRRRFRHGNPWDKWQFTSLAHLHCPFSRTYQESEQFTLHTLKPFPDEEQFCHWYCRISWHYSSRHHRVARVPIRALWKLDLEQPWIRRRKHPHVRLFWKVKIERHRIRRRKHPQGYINWRFFEQRNGWLYRIEFWDRQCK